MTEFHSHSIRQKMANPIKDARQVMRESDARKKYKLIFKLKDFLMYKKLKKLAKVPIPEVKMRPSKRGISVVVERSVKTKSSLVNTPKCKYRKRKPLSKQKDSFLRLNSVFGGEIESCAISSDK